MMEARTYSETLNTNSAAEKLFAQDQFVAYSHDEIINTYVHTHRTLTKETFE
jgi:hypothetical protein